MDEFAQTRAPDDLFDDDFTPITEPPIQEFVPASQLHAQRGGRSDRPRGNRGRGRTFPQQQEQHQHQQRSQDTTVAQSLTTSVQDIPPASTTNDAGPITNESNTAGTKPPTAVRGDRSATGGTAKPKLTEEELSARLAAAKLNNAKREEAHRAAEADEASFQQREAQASQRRQEEGRARRLMDQERERNRLRKLGAQGGREWDEGKEDRPVDSRRSQFRRGAYGGTSGHQGVEDRRGDSFEHEVDEYGDRDYGQRGGRGRGGRGRGRGGRGRGGFEDRGVNVEATKPPLPNAETDFPALPSTNPPKTGNRPNSSLPNGLKQNQQQQQQQQQQANVEVPTFQSPTGDGQTWADEVEGNRPSGGW
ncbi:MAG: hypothetical protein Q9174_005772 [Haloplaca sp. 1 TL-2023]